MALTCVMPMGWDELVDDDPAAPEVRLRLVGWRAQRLNDPAGFRRDLSLIWEFTGHELVVEA
jgi:hypothetical protein